MNSTNTIDRPQNVLASRRRVNPVLGLSRDRLLEYSQQSCPRVFSRNVGCRHVPNQ